MSVTVDSHGPITVVKIVRPERRNAVDRSTARALWEAFLAFDADPVARVAVLTGGGGTFCAGADLQAIAAQEPNEVLLRDEMVGSPGPMGPTRLELTKPVIAAIEGHAVAGGLELAIWCDLRVAASDAVLGVYSRRFGVPLIDGGTVRLPRLIGHGRALDLILTGRGVDAAQARAMGLVDRVVEPGMALEAARELAALIAGHPQLCLRADLASAREQWGVPLEDALRAEAGRGIGVLASGEAARGAAAFTAGAGRHGTPR